MPLSINPAVIVGKLRQGINVPMQDSKGKGVWIGEGSRLFRSVFRVVDHIITVSHSGVRVFQRNGWWLGKLLPSESRTVKLEDLTVSLTPFVASTPARVGTLLTPCRSTHVFCTNLCS